MHYRDTFLQVDLDALQANIQTYRQITQKQVIAVVKANAYGTDDFMIAQNALEAGATMLAVSSLEEALSLRIQGIQAPILVLGYVHPENITTLIQHHISTVLVSLDWLQEVYQQDCHGLSLHLKIDTGMNRIGLKGLKECQTAVELCRQHHICLDGVTTHFACADCDSHKTHQQFQQFREIVEQLNIPFTWIHADNSDAALTLKEDFTNAVRVGIGMYGLAATSLSENVSFKPVLSLYTTVTRVKTVEPNETIGYGATYSPTQSETIATLPIGYADGWLRKNQGRSVYINGEYAEIVGRVCMDQCMIRLSKPCPIATIVECFGEHIPLLQVAQELDTIVYEVITILSDRITRHFIKNGTCILAQAPRYKQLSQS